MERTDSFAVDDDVICRVGADAQRPIECKGLFPERIGPGAGRRSQREFEDD